MSTLLLRLAAPLQSWGVSSKFDRRGTERAPSKSGVIGLLAAAFGISRDEANVDCDKFARLAALKFGVRTDWPGELLHDFQTARNEKTAYVTHRYYLADAAFVCGLEGDEEVLREAEAAVRSPVFPLFLGRRSCPPEGRVDLGVSPLPLLDALKQCPLLEKRGRKPSAEPRVSVDADDGVYFVRDQPVSFSKSHRQFSFRRVREFGVEQNPFAELEDDHDVPVSD